MTRAPNRNPHSSAPVTFLRIAGRMLLNLLRYGRPIPPRYIFREPPN